MIPILITTSKILGVCLILLAIIVSLTILAQKLHKTTMDKVFSGAEERHKKGKSTGHAEFWKKLEE